MAASLKQMKEIRVKVCVIGCGISGAAAAGELVAAGMKDVIVLEAAGRYGGRVHTIKHGDSHLEMGANWLHGEKGNCVYEWAKKNCPQRLLQESEPVMLSKDKYMCVDPHGAVLPTDLAASIEDAIDELENEDLSDCEGSLGEYFEEQFSAVNKWGSVGWQMLDWYGRLQCNIDGSASWHQVSAATRSEYWELPGNPGGNWASHGYQTIIDHLVDRVGRERILLNSPALKVAWGEAALVDQLATRLSSLSADTPVGQPETSEDASAPSTAAQNRPPPCRIALADQVVVADHVIYSASLGVLKATAQHFFSPQLPPRKMLAIESLGFDAVAKVFVQFEQPWWPADCAGFNFLNDLSVPPRDPVQEWEEQFLGFYPVVQQPCMLLGWLSGAAAQAMEATALPDVIARTHAVLAKRLANVFYVPKPVWGTRSTWSSNPSIRGAYSFRTMLADDCDVWAADLAQPVVLRGVPVLQFCGEATHRHLYSTVPGAWEAGVREARRLLAFLRHGVLPRHRHVASLPDSVEAQPRWLMPRDDADSPLTDEAEAVSEAADPESDGHSSAADKTSSAAGLLGLKYLQATPLFSLSDASHMSVDQDALT